MTDTDEAINLQHFGRDPTDIQIRINLEIQILDDFELTFPP